MTQILSIVQKAAAVTEYFAGDSLPALAKRYQVSRTAIRGILARRGVQLRPGRRNQRYPCNDRFFADIDSEIPAYVLGFITADGCINGNRLIINLARRDEGHLEAIRQALRAESPLRRITHTTQLGIAWPLSELRLSSPALVADLAALGVLPRKSLIATPWQAPSRLRRHYLRGLIDGDGSWYCSSDGRWHLALVGTRSTVDYFADYVLEVAGFRASVRPGHGKIWEVKLSNHLALQIVASDLYRGATLFLNRKKSRADTILSTYKARRITSRFVRVPSVSGETC